MKHHYLFLIFLYCIIWAGCADKNNGDLGRLFFDEAPPDAPTLIVSNFEFRRTISASQQVLYIQVSIKNEGQLPAENVKMVLEYDNEYITQKFPALDQNLGTILVNEISTNVYGSHDDSSTDGFPYSYEVFLKAGAPAQEKITFTVKLTDVEGQSWTPTFEIAL